jgi:hypothetical protein
MLTFALCVARLLGKKRNGGVREYLTASQAVEEVKARLVAALETQPALDESHASAADALENIGSSTSADTYTDAHTQHILTGTGTTSSPIPAAAEESPMPEPVRTPVASPALASGDSGGGSSSSDSDLPAAAAAAADDGASAPTAPTPAEVATAPPAARRSAAVEDQLAERRQRLEEEEAQRRARDAAAAADANKRTRETSYAQEQRRRQHEAQQERQRILRLVEDDRRERRARDELRRAQAQARAAAAAAAAAGTREDAPSGVSDADGATDRGGSSARASASAPSASTSATAVPPLPPRGPSGHCAIQVRLLDGSSIRARFAPDATIATHVRGWIDAHYASTTTAPTSSPLPYTLKHIRAPQPSRAISVREEHEQTLAALGLHPSATLVMAPSVAQYATAYTGRHGVGAGGGVGVSAGGASSAWTPSWLLSSLPGGSYLSRALALGYGAAAAGAGMLAGAARAVYGLVMGGGGGGGDGGGGGNAGDRRQQQQQQQRQQRAAGGALDDGRAAGTPAAAAAALRARSPRIQTLHGRSDANNSDSHSDADEGSQQFYNGNQVSPMDFSFFFFFFFFF